MVEEKKQKRDLSGYAALLVAVTGLITVFVHKPTEDAAKAGYMELTTAILETQAVEKQNHEDIVALHTFLEGYVKEHASLVTEVPTASTSTAVPFLPPPHPVFAHPMSHPAPPATGSASAVPAPSPVPEAVTVVAVAPSSAPRPPAPAPQAAPRRPREAKDMTW